MSCGESCENGVRVLHARSLPFREEGSRCRLPCDVHHLFSLLLVSLVLLAALPVRAASVTSTWLGGAGSWTDPTHWSGAVVPQNTSTDSFDVAIDGANDLASEVTLDAAETIGALQVTAGDSLVVTLTGQLTLDGDRIVNAGEIVLHGTGSTPYGEPQSLSLAPDTMLSGAGSIHLDGGGLLGRNEYNDPVGLVNVDNLIEGWGTIHSPGFTNYAAIEANVAGEVLDVHTNYGFNYGTMRAVNGASLFLENYCCGFANLGLIEALDGSHVGTTDTIHTGPGSVFRALRHSTMQLAGSYSGEFVTDADSVISIGGNDQTSIGDATLDGNIELVGLYMSGTITNRGVVRLDVTVNGPPATIINQGQVIFQYAQLGTLSFSGGGLVTLDATNGDSGPVSLIRNVDNEMRGTGRLRLSENGGLIEASGGVLSVGGSDINDTGVFAAATGGVLEMEATVTGSGAWRADGGEIHVTGNVGTAGDIAVLHGGSLVVDTEMSGGDLVLDDTGSLDVEGILRVAGDVDLDGANGGRWRFGPSASLEINGSRGAAVGDWGDWQFLEATGINLFLQPVGIDRTGLYLPEIVIGSDGRLVLRDRRDNGNRPFDFPEVVYVDTLIFSDSLGLLNVNGIHLYYNHLVGSVDQIIDVAVPEPYTVWLLGAALAVAAAARELRSREP